MTEIRRRSLLGGAAAIAAAPAIIGRARAQAKGDLVVAVPANLVTLDPGDANNTLDQGVCRLFMQGLFGFDRDMKAAEAALRPDGEHWYGPRDAAELAAVRGAGELVLGRHREAADTLSWALERMSSSAVNWRALVAADRDRALAAQ